MGTNIRVIVKVNGLPVTQHYDTTGNVMVDFNKQARPHHFLTASKALQVAEKLGGKAIRITETWKEEEVLGDDNET